MIPYIITAIEDESDREFMTALFFQYQKLLYSTIQKYTRDQWLVDDIFQTTLEKLIGKLSFLRTLDRDRLVNYLIATARNTAYNEFRYRTRHTAENYDDFDEMYPAEDSRSNVESALIHKEDMARLSEIWPKLDARAQYLLEAKYILGKKSPEIAADLHIKPESVRMALSRARKTAYQLMNPSAGGSGA